MSPSDFAGIAHAPEGDDHANGQQDAGDDTSCAEEDHFIFNIKHQLGLLPDMQVIDQGLQALFVHKIAEVADAGTDHPGKQHGDGDNSHLDPFHACDETDGQQENIPGEGNEEYNQQRILRIERELDLVVPDWEENDHDDESGENPPEDFGQCFMLNYAMRHCGREDTLWW